jgi:alkylglycerol monooxygenase
MVNLIALAIPMFFVLIGIEVLIARAMGLQVYRFNDAITDLACGISSQVTKAFVGILSVVPYAWLYEHHRLASLPEGALTTHLLAFLGVDLAYYAWHRWTHEMNLGWATHVVHHQSEDYNLAVALRQSITSSMSSWPFYLPFALLGVPPVVFLTHSALNTLYQFWIHTETIGRLGPLEWVLNTPSHHRVHHAINPRYLDRNYAGVLIVWDRLFGTFEPETEPPVYGTVEPLRSFNPLWANVWWGWGLLQDSAAAKTWKDALRVWVARPGWRPSGLPPHPSPREISPETAPAKYHPVGYPGLVGYVLVQFVPVTLATTAVSWFDHAVWDGPRARAWLLLAMVAVCWTLLGWGALFERKSYALPLEHARLAALVALGLALGWAGTLSWGIALAGIGAAALSALWITRIVRG